MSKQIKYKNVSEMKYSVAKTILENEIKCIKNVGLSANQILFLQVLFYDETKFLYEYLDVDFTHSKTKVKNMTESTVQDLYTRGYVDRLWVRSKDYPYPDFVEITDKGRELVSEILDVNLGVIDNLKQEELDKIKDKQALEDQLVFELFEAYPNSITINGNKVSLKSCKPVQYEDTLYQGKDGIGELYCKLIDFNLDLHNEIIQKIKADESNGQEVTNVAISNFVLNRAWENMISNDIYKII